jgi:hypothetical protein
MTKTRKVILWGENDLLNRAMEMVLTAGETDKWEILRLPANQSISALAEQVQNVKPDLVILYQPNASNSGDPLLKLLEEEPELKVIAEQPESRVITVSLENNVMQVYSKHSVTIRHVSDLLSVIEDSYFSEDKLPEEVNKTRKFIV